MAAADIEDARGDVRGGATGDSTGDATGDAWGRDRWAAFRARPGWVRQLANIALTLSVAAIGVTLLFTKAIDGDQLPAAAVVIVAFAVVLGTLVGVARWAYTALAGRVDILTQALDASP